MKLNKKNVYAGCAIVLMLAFAGAIFLTGNLHLAEADHLPFVPACADLHDNDGDGFADFVPVVGGEGFGPDPNCDDLFDDDEGPFSPPPPPPTSPQCSNGLDDDGDGFVDDDDPNCHTDGDPNNGDSYNPDDSESGTLPVCFNGVDDDGDGLTDWAPGEDGDPGCSTPTDADEGDDVSPPSDNIPPVAQNKTIVTNEDTATSSALVATDSDVPAQTLTYSIVTSPSDGIISGLNVLTGDFTYTPNLNYNGPDSFTYRANDGSANSNTATVSITVNSGSDLSNAACSDESDNDVDGLNNQADPGCHSDGNVNNPSSYVPNDNDESNTSAECGDGKDNDNDGSIDSNDPNCHSDGNAGNPPSYDPNDTSEGSAPAEDLCSNLEGIQESVPSGMVESGGICTVPTGGGGGGGGGGNGGGYYGGNGAPLGSIIVASGGGLVLGASTGLTTGAVLGVSAENCNAYLTGYIRHMGQNDKEQVLRLQRFLRDLEGFDTVRETGIYDDASLAAVHSFQIKYAPKILTPWGATRSTGFVYYTTKKAINERYCKFTKEFSLTADQIAEIERIKTLPEARPHALPAPSVTPPLTPTSDTEATATPTQKKEDKIGSLAPESQPAAVGASKAGSWWTRLLDRAFRR